MVQVEFFRTSKIGLSIRFFDRDGKLTKLALEFGGLEAITLKIASDFADADQREQDRMENLQRRTTTTKSAIRAQLKHLVREKLGNMATAGPVAIETPKTFRLAEMAEIPGLLATAIEAEHMWLFVFEPAELSADGLTSVGRIM